MDKIFVTVPEASKLLGCHSDKVWALIRNGQLQEFRDRNTIMVKTEEVKFLKDIINSGHEVVKEDGLPPYIDELDAEEQISAEEWIAAQLFDHPDSGIGEQLAGDFGRSLLRGILWRFRQDLFKPKENSTDAGTKPGT
mgnify:CR=1 FL=1